MHEDDLLDQEAAHLDVSHVLLYSINDRSEARAHVREALLLAEELILLAILQDHFDLVTDLAVAEVSFDEAVVDLHVCDVLHQGLEQQITRYEELLLVVDELDDAIAVDEIVQHDRLSVEVLSNASHLYCIGREESASVQERWPLECDRKVSLRLNQHSDDPFVPVDDEVPAKLEAVFLPMDELLFREPMEIAELGAHHHRDVPEAHGHAHLLFVIDLARHRGVKRCRVCKGPQTAFVRVQLALHVNLCLAAVALVKASEESVSCASNCLPSGICSLWQLELQILKPDRHPLERKFSLVAVGWSHDLGGHRVLVDPRQASAKCKIERLNVVRRDVPEPILDQVALEERLPREILRLLRFIQFCLLSSFLMLH